MTYREKTIKCDVAWNRMQVAMGKWKEFYATGDFEDLDLMESIINEYNAGVDEYNAVNDEFDATPLWKKIFG